MTMRVLYGAGPGDIDGYGTERLRAEFLVERLFEPGRIEFAYTHVDRMIVGGACPADEALSFGDGADVGTPCFFTAREMGIANLGGAGTVTVDGQRFALANRDVLYVGRGAQEVRLESDSAAQPARFYMNSVPAGADIAHRLITKSQSKPLELGEERRASKRILRMYIHPEVTPSCLLLMGITDLAPGSVWNTMPPHLHERRMEAYLYFDLAARGPGNPSDGAAGQYPPPDRGQWRLRDLAGLVDPHGQRHRPLCLRVGHDRRKPGLQRRVTRTGRGTEMNMQEPAHTLRRPLAAGSPIVYWLLGATSEQRYDVADQPMKGEMDPFFFLTKHKNFIPHEYPCRTEFAAERRGKRPQPQGAFEADRVWLPFGSPRVDLSGFWFRPTVIGTWARTGLHAAAAGPARLGCAPAAAPCCSSTEPRPAGWRPMDAISKPPRTSKWNSLPAPTTSASGSTISPSATPAISSSWTMLSGPSVEHALPITVEERHRDGDGGRTRSDAFRVSGLFATARSRWRPM